jgi:hypothetical protein
MSVAIIVVFLFALFLPIAIAMYEQGKQEKKPEERLTPKRSFEPLGRSFEAPDERRGRDQSST